MGHHSVQHPTSSLLIALFVAALYLCGCCALASQNEVALEADDSATAPRDITLEQRVNNIVAAPTNPVAWYNLASALQSLDQKVGVLDEKLTRKQVLEKAASLASAVRGAGTVKLNPSVAANIFYNLGKELQLIEQQQGAPVLQTLSSTIQQATRQQQQQQQQRTKVTALVRGMPMDRLACYSRALEYDPHLRDGWNNLATAIMEHPVDDFATVSGVKYTAKQALVQELEQDSQHVSANYNAAVVLDMEAQQQQQQRENKHNNKKQTKASKPTIEVDSKRLDKKALLRRAFEASGLTHGAAAHNLAAMLDAGETVAIRKKKYAAIDLYVLAVENAQSSHAAAASWMGVGTLLPEEGAVTIAGVSRAKAYCLKRAINLTKDGSVAAAAFNNLAAISTTEPDEKRELLRRAVSADPTSSTSWTNLCNIISNAEKIVVNDKSYTRDDCEAHVRTLEKQQKSG